LKKSSDVEITTQQDVIVQFTEDYELNKKLTITIPKGYIVFVYIEGKATIKLTECVKKPVYNSNFGKLYLGKNVSFAFCQINGLKEIHYGFGPINVNNERLKEAYRVGINGHLQAEITSFSKMIEFYQGQQKITIEDIRESLLPIIKFVGTQVLSSCFAYSNVSVFEIDSQLGAIREDISLNLTKESIFDKIGIKINVCHLNPIYVNESDLELIRNRINGQGE
jgi:hypothetical protein